MEERLRTIDARRVEHAVALLHELGGPVRDVAEPDMQLPLRDLVRERGLEPQRRRVLRTFESRVGVLRAGLAGGRATVEIVQPVQRKEVAVEIDLEAEGR